MAKMTLMKQESDPVELWLTSVLDSDLPRTRKQVCLALAWMASTFGNPVDVDRNSLLRWTGYASYGGDWRALMTILNDLDGAGWIKINDRERKKVRQLLLPLEAEVGDGSR